MFSNKERKEQLVRKLLYEIGENPEREGVVDTPARVVRMWDEIFGGYNLDNRPTVSVFENGKDGIVMDQMITDSGDFYSHCEHHMVPFFGQYYFAYIPHPEGLIIGLSKVARLVDYHSAKLQIQERLVHDIVEDIWESLSTKITDDGITTIVEPLGMALVMKGEHLCKTMRGVKKKGQMTTSKLKGVFEKPEVRQEFMNLISK